MAKWLIRIVASYALLRHAIPDYTKRIIDNSRFGVLNNDKEHLHLLEPNCTTPSATVANYRAVITSSRFQQMG